ncbi:MAG: 50S ribosomal protein L18 [Eubacteriales bacterium]|nr:50S ribosomal protein L18 [Eubacteriales bacterium]NCC81104.1 50S ribosomal protein L18 [Clostridia bacterium]
MIKKTPRKKTRANKHARIRYTLKGTAERPRLCVYRSLNNIYGQIIDDQKGVTLVSASSLKEDFGGNAEGAKKIGAEIAKKALEKGITKVVFDRGGLMYHGRIKSFAEGAREAGLEF